MTQTKELPPLVLPHTLYSDLKLDKDNVYTVTLSVNLGFMAGLLDTLLGRSVLRIVSAVVAAGGFVASLAVILLAPFFPALVSTAPPQVAHPPSATSSPTRRRRTYEPSANITVSVRRDPSIVPIIERSERDSASPSPAPPARRVSFSPQSSSTSVPTLSHGTVDPPSHPGSSNGHVTSAVRRVREEEAEAGAYNLPTPPASIASMSSEGDEVGAEEFGMISPNVGKRGRRSFLFSPKRNGSVKGKERQSVGDGESSATRQRAHSLALSTLEGASKRSSWISHSSRESSAYDDTLREPEPEADRASRTSMTEKESKRRSGLSFQDFKAAFGKRERRAALISASGSYALSPSESYSTPRSLELGRTSSVSSHPSPRSVSDELARKTRASSPPLRLDIAHSPSETERREVQSPITDPTTRPLFGGEVVIRNESGRRRTRSSAIPGLYADAEVVRRW
ncbi:transmembrane protein, putative [Rhizoctonia solani AG-3 Rhs1AP]|uniref:Transmembrane protein, putative n=1 Tax=Rhizoctonia solani AG-3 Rhs1AP TaxID=1086054 RepID=X8J2W9_9AGAM|nr:transmembrane protein, putative [Rhizoctonia solani AG-3 Rhs1AP]